MHPGMIGLGRMGANLVRRLTKDGHDCVVVDVNPAALKAIAGRRSQAADSLGELFAKALGIDLVDILGARRASGKPAAGRTDANSAGVGVYSPPMPMLMMSSRMRLPLRGMRRATCNAGRFSLTLMCSPGTWRRCVAGAGGRVPVAAAASVPARRCAAWKSPSSNRRR